jgi:endonuclease/exonuclease/phosphatase family metal-dependent hydrolase
MGTSAVTLRARRGAILLAILPAIVLCPVMAAGAGPQREDASGRLRVLQFNVCDQGHQVGHACSEDWPIRRTEIVRQLDRWRDVRAAAFQEVCESTFSGVLADKPGWSGAFYKTYDVNDGRCGADNDWGVAFIAKSVTSDVTTTILGQEPYGEWRVLTCGDVTISRTLRLCSTHLSPSGPQDQVNAIENAMRGHLAGGAAVIIGGDFNINNKLDCETGIPTKLQPLYALYYGGSTTHSCGPGDGSYRDADQYLATGDGTYDAPTFQADKIDYLFFNTARFNQTGFRGETVASFVSDHRVLRGAMTIHD